MLSVRLFINYGCTFLEFLDPPARIFFLNVESRGST